MHTINPSTQEAEAGGSLCFHGQPGLQSEFQVSQGYTEKPCLKKPKENESVRSSVKLYSFRMAVLTSQKFMERYRCWV